MACTRTSTTPPATWSRRSTPAAAGTTRSKPRSARASKTSRRPAPGDGSGHRGRLTPVAGSPDQNPEASRASEDMAGGRKIKTKIKSVQNTRKVTRALEMVSASKIRKAQERMKASRPYARAMKQMIGHLAQANTDFQHPFLVERAEVKRVGYVIVSSDRGLAGGLNNNLFRKLLGEMRQWQEKGVEVDVVTIGQKATVFFRRLRVGMLASVTHLGDNPEVEQLIGLVKVMLDGYTEGRHDRVFMVYNDFVNTMTQRAAFDQLL